MKPAVARQKGQDFERSQSRLFSLWVSEGQDNDLFWRSNASGARSTSGSIKKAQYGDLALAEHEGKWVNQAARFLSQFCVELKFHKLIDLHAALINEKDDLRLCWEQCKGDADRNSVSSMLIAKMNRRDALLFTTPAVAHKLNPIISTVYMSKVMIFDAYDVNFRVCGYIQTQFFSLLSCKRVLACMEGK